MYYNHFLSPTKILALQTCWLGNDPFPLAWHGFRWGSIISLCIDGVRREERPCSVSSHDFGCRGWRMFGMDWLGVPLWGYPTPFPLVPIYRVYRHIVHFFLPRKEKLVLQPPFFKGDLLFFCVRKSRRWAYGFFHGGLGWRLMPVSSWFQVNGELPNFSNDSDALAALALTEFHHRFWGPLFLHTVAVTHVDRSRLRGELGDVWYCVAALTCFKRHCFPWWRQTRPDSKIEGPKMQAFPLKTSKFLMDSHESNPQSEWFPQQNSRP